MKLVIYLIAIAISLIAGTSLFHFQRSAELSRVKIAHENGDLSSQVVHRLEDKLGEVTSGWLDIGSARRNSIAELQTISARATENSKLSAQVAAVSLAVAVLAGLAHSPERRKRMLAGPILGCWFLGVALPVITVTVATRVNQLGTIVLREESKSLGTIVAKLASEGDVLMLLLVGIFSLGIPLIKIISYTLPHDWNTAHKFGTTLARWSLSEVLVIALVVLFLGMNRDGETDASLQLGFWFFASSAILSMLLGMMGSAPNRPLSDRSISSTNNP